MKYYVDMVLELIEGRWWSPEAISVVFPVQYREKIDAIIDDIKQDLLSCA